MTMVMDGIIHSKDCRNRCDRVVLSCQRRLSICLDENGERDDREMDNIELDDLSDSDDELWLICFVLLNDVIYMFFVLSFYGPIAV